MKARVSIQKADKIYSLELEDIEDWQKAFRELEAKLELWLKNKIEVALDPGFLDKLPWQPYANGRGEWIKADLADAQELREKLSEIPGFMLKIGDYQYRLQGDRLQFISRRRLT
ncbi:MAG: hypothetical protein QXK81_06860 [Candidatus Bathyarchaeia archaeon]|nr:hypothetical protein [Candidatus Bathyarchaeota archaeon]